MVSGPLTAEPFDLGLLHRIARTRVRTDLRVLGEGQAARLAAVNEVGTDEHEVRRPADEQLHILCRVLRSKADAVDDRVER